MHHSHEKLAQEGRMEILWWLSATLVWIVWAILSWLLVQAFWLILWFTLPICVVGILAVLAAERFLGKELVRPWIRKQWRRFRKAVWQRARRVLVAVWAAPVRVASWFVIFALWHAVLNLLLTPRWTPWRRAWRRRWGYA
jgi:hypothetical protein